MIDFNEWKKIQNETGLFEVIQQDEIYTVCSKMRGWEKFPCTNENAAKELCDYLNLLTRSLMLTKTLPEPLLLKNDSPVYDLGNMINKKQCKLEELQLAVNHELRCELSYTHQANSIRLRPAEIQEELGLSKLPTEKQVNAYIENKLSFEFDLWKIAKADTSLIRQQLDIMNDRVSFEKYALRMRLNHE